jgi:putative transposase
VSWIRMRTYCISGCVMSGSGQRWRNDPYSDRSSSQYAAHDMAAACAQHRLRRSMGATGMCWENAGTESLWSSFKHEGDFRHAFTTELELIAAVDN